MSGTKNKLFVMQAGCCALLVIGLPGCQSFSFLKPPSDDVVPGSIATVAHEVDTGDEAKERPTLQAQAARRSEQLGRFVTGREQLDRNRAVQLYQQGDRTFREAMELDRDQAKPQYSQAAKLFSRAAEAHPDSALEQDALMMAGESFFFADQLRMAEDRFSKLQKNHPRSRHSDRAAARLFEISQYWIETHKAGVNISPINLFDPSRPIIDTKGHAIRLLDNIRYNDPTGLLADDATMAAAVEKMRHGRYQDADELFADLRETFPDSEHQFNAHILGLRTKLLVYAGPGYSGVMLDEAEKLLRQTRRRFPDRMRDPTLSEELAKISAEIEYRKAEKLVYRARYRERRREFGAARVYYQEVLEKHVMTPFADTARERLAAFADEPDLPPRRLAWLADMFPNENRSKPLIMGEGGTLLR